jgi:hypothetical protein
MKTIPDINTFVTFAPIDYVSNAIVSLSQLDNVSGCNYHLNNPHQTTWKQISVWIESAGYPLKTIPYHEWEEQLIQETQLNENILSPLLPFFLKKWSTSNYTFAELAVHRARLDCSNTADKLKTLNITLKSVGVRARNPRVTQSPVCSGLRHISIQLMEGKFLPEQIKIQLMPSSGVARTRFPRHELLRAHALHI